MVVAAGTVDGEALECGEGRHHHVVAVVVAGDESVGLRDGQLNVPDEIPRAGGDEAERDDAFRLFRVENIARELFLDETRPGLVAVQRADDVIAVRPRGHAKLVLVVAVGFAEVNDIEPVPGPSFAIARAGEEAVHEAFDCRLRIANCRFEEGVHLIWRRRQAGQVESNPANERGRISLGRWLKIFLRNLGLDEPVQRMCHWRQGTNLRRHRRTRDLTEGPPTGRRRKLLPGGIPLGGQKCANSQSQEDQPCLRRWEWKSHTGHKTEF